MTLEEAAHLATKAGEEYGEYVNRIKENDLLLKNLVSAQICTLGDGPVTKLDHLARNTYEYKQLSRTVSKDYREHGRRKMAYESACRIWETIRSEMADKRNERKHFG